MSRNKKYIILFLLFLTALFSPFIIKELRGSYTNPIEITDLTNLKFPINTAGDEFSPTLTSDGKIMLFNSKNQSGGNHHIYISRFLNGRWTTPEYFDEINSKYDNDETPFISADGSMIIFSSDREGSLRPDPSYYGEERVTYDLYMSRKVEGKWTKPERLPGDVNTIDNERSPTMTPDMRTLYFTRWPFKNIKKGMIMQATFKDGIYTDVRELQPPVNTGNYEISLSPSTKRPGFYFASRRPGGLGGWDIYFVYYLNGQFSNVINLGPEINSDSNELFFSEVGDKIFFCSNREGGLGLYDIYTANIKKFNIDDFAKPKEHEGANTSYKKETGGKEAGKEPKAKNGKNGRKEQGEDGSKKEPDTVKTGDGKTEKTTVTVKKGEETVSLKEGKTEIKVRVIKKPVEAPLSVNVKIYLKDSQDPSKKALRSLTKRSDSDGMITLTPKEDVEWIVLKLEQGGYEPIRTVVKVEKGKSQDVLMVLTPLPAKAPVRKKVAVPEKKKAPENIVPDDGEFKLKPVYFNFNSAEIKLQDYPYIHKVINYLRKNKSLRLKISGHSDRYGSREANDDISLSRAKTIRDYFVKLGLAPDRFEITGMGSQVPSSLNGRGKFSDYNRRVEFSIIENLAPNGFD